jgi:uncharacterized membrane protein
MAILRILVRWLLPASITLNVFLAAALITHIRGEWFVRDEWSHRRPPPPSATSMLDQMANLLSPEDAKILRQALEPRLVEMDRMAPEDDAIRRRMEAILRQDPFDKTAFREQLEQGQRAHAILVEALPEALAQLSPEGRQRLAQWQPGPRPPHDGGPFEGHPPPDGPHPDAPGRPPRP